MSFSGARRCCRGEYGWIGLGFPVGCFVYFASAVVLFLVLYLSLFSFFFFFSSRRRHTRLVSDWSSDVCSSDLLVLRRNLGRRRTRQAGGGIPFGVSASCQWRRGTAAGHQGPRYDAEECKKH